jgi:hypothetical protein
MESTCRGSSCIVRPAQLYGVGWRRLGSGSIGCQITGLDDPSASKQLIRNCKGGLKDCDYEWLDEGRRQVDERAEPICYGDGSDLAAGVVF